jgi:4-hydroxy-tetrahydrodipicolinate synthase
VAPALCAALQEACDRRDVESIARLEAILAPLHAAMFLEANPIPVKRALYRMGFMLDGLRLPLTPLSQAADVQLAEVLKSRLPMEEAERRRAQSGHRSLRPWAA